VTFSSRQASSQLLVATFLRISNVFPGKLTKNALKTLANTAASSTLARRQPFLCRYLQMGTTKKKDTKTKRKTDRPESGEQPNAAISYFTKVVVASSPRH